ncbi:MAG: ABC transporter ATP-binding protein [Clostridiales bacterium]
MNIILKSLNLKKYYKTKENIVKAVDGINLDIEKGEFVSIVGTSGSGKSTLLHMLGGLDIPSEGKVFVKDKDLSTLNEEELTIFRRRNIGFIFQNYNLIQIMDAYNNIVLPIRLDGIKIDDKYINKIINVLGIEGKLNVMPNKLSGGEQQRVSIARALAIKPSIILADEPTGNLDSKTSQEVLGLIKITSQKFHQTVVMITHNEEIAQLADRSVHIEDGIIMRG